MNMIIVRVQKASSKQEGEWTQLAQKRVRGLNTIGGTMIAQSQVAMRRIKVPINSAIKTQKHQQRIGQIHRIGTRVIRAFLNITKYHESELLECQRSIMTHHIRRTCTHENIAINIVKRLIMLTKSMHSVGGLGKWGISLQTGISSRLKARKKIPSHGKSLLSEKEQTSCSGESAAVHFVQSDLVSLSDEIGECDDDLAVVRTVEKLAVAGGDVPALKQENETRSSGGILSR
jgi:hypothetical protein